MTRIRPLRVERCQWTGRFAAYAFLVAVSALSLARADEPFLSLHGRDKSAAEMLGFSRLLDNGSRAVVGEGRLLALTAALGLPAASTNGDPASASAHSGSIWRSLFACDVPLERKWSFEFGVGVISDNTLADYTEPRLNKLHGPGGGVTYNFTVARRVHQFNWKVGSVTLRPEIEVPARLTLVDENSGKFIPDLNVGFVLRWRDFPWNRFLRTTLAAGPGFSYSFQVWTAEYQRHQDEDDKERSRLKFWLPIEFTFALPWYPRHQMVAFADHQSGGTLFDTGGVDAWGLGYRFEF